MLHPGENAARAVRHPVPEGRTRRLRRGVGLREGAARLDRPLAAAPLVALGTDGFGRSENRAALRDFFEVDAKHIVLAPRWVRWRGRKQTQAGNSCKKAIKDLRINPEKPNPAIS